MGLGPNFAATVVKHLTLGVYGLGCEDALQHLLNFVWPNIFEQVPSRTLPLLSSLAARLCRTPFPVPHTFSHAYARLALVGTSGSCIRPVARGIVRGASARDGGNAKARDS